MDKFGMCPLHLAVVRSIPGSYGLSYGSFANHLFPTQYKCVTT